MTYIKAQGDMWDGIAYKVFGNSNVIEQQDVQYSVFLWDGV